MTSFDRTGQPARPEDLVDVARLVTAYYAEHPDPEEPGQRLRFGTSGHHGSSLDAACSDEHIAAITQAICDIGRTAGVDGPVFLAKDRHALSEAAWTTSLEVLAGGQQAGWGA